MLVPGPTPPAHGPSARTAVRATHADAWTPTTYARYGRPVLRTALLALVLLPTLALALPIAALNALVFGPRNVLFLQPRVGRHGRVFRIVKCRTMRGTDVEGPDDARVTRLGRFLRSTHLDELPQLWNVLRGEMDLIGPRPEMLSIDAWARARIPGFRERNAVLPGLTGLAQITQGYVERDEHAYRLKLELDRRYLARFSLAQDLAILAGTALWVLRGRGWTIRPRPRVRRTDGGRRAALGSEVECSAKVFAPERALDPDRTGTAADAGGRGSACSLRG
jgi:lipopolysaccharide/colanic/teichoic acid biosynthesis glycosyltransferase